MLDDVVGSEEEDEEEDDEEEWHHFPRPPVQEVCPGDHLRDCYEVFFPILFVSPLLSDCCGRHKR